MTDEVRREADFPATVVEAGRRAVLNRGARHGVTLGRRFLIYTLDEGELTDPDSGEPLGRLERVKASGKVINVQERMCTLQLDGDAPVSRWRAGRNSPFQAFPGIKREEAPQASSSEPTRGDLAKPIG